MVDTITTLGKPGGGGDPAYFSTKEVPHGDLAGGTLTLTSADMKKTHLIYSSVEGAKVVLPDSRTLSAIGLGVGFKVSPRSKSVRLINPGTPGTDAILEAFMLSGANAKFFAQSIATAAGDWHGGGYGLYSGPVPVTLPVSYDAGLDTGDVSGSTGGYFLPSKFLEMSTAGTLFAALWSNNAGTAVKSALATYNHATDAWTWGSAATIFSVTGVVTDHGMVAFDATHIGYIGWNNTSGLTGQIVLNAASISGTTLTPGTAINSSAWTTSVYNDHSAQGSVAMVADSSTSCIMVANNNGPLGLDRMSLSGNTLTHSGGLSVSSMGSVLGASGVTLATAGANTVDLGFGNDGAFGIGRYTYAASAITATFSRRNKSNNGVGGYIQLVDPANKIYYTRGSTTDVLVRMVLKSDNSDIIEEEVFRGPIFSTMSGACCSPGKDIFFLSDDEAIAFWNVDAGGYGFALVDVKRLRHNGQSTVTVDANRLPSPTLAVGPVVAAATDILGARVLTTMRRLAILYTNRDQSNAKGRILRGHMFDLPRNYDKAC